MINKRNMAICAAANEIGIKESDMKNVLVNYRGGFYDISFTTEWMMYEIFVCEGYFEVMGVDYRPIPVNTLLGSLPEAGQDAS